MIGGMVDLDLLSCFPKDGQESLEGSGGIKLSKSATMEERESKRFTKILRTVGEEGALKRVPWESGRWAQNSAGPVVGRYYRPK